MATNHCNEIVSTHYSSIPSVAEWMRQNQDLWSWLEQRRGDRTRKVAPTSKRHLPNHQQCSTSSLTLSIGNYSEVDDADFCFIPRDIFPRKPVRRANMELSSAGLEGIGVATNLQC